MYIYIYIPLLTLLPPDKSRFYSYDSIAFTIAKISVQTTDKGLGVH